MFRRLTRSTRLIRVLLLPLAIAVSQWASSASAAVTGCPQSICACLGQAAKFDVLATQSLKMRIASYRSYGYTYLTPSAIAGSACGKTASIAASSDAIITIDGDLTLLAPAGEVAATFKARGDGSAGTSIGGDLATAGGSIKGADLVFVNGGPPDTSGRHPNVSSCNQAMLDAADAASTFAALPPTQSLGKLVVKGGAEPTVITTQAGVNVINATSIAVKPVRVYGQREASQLEIDIHPDADAIIINTDALKIGANCGLTLTGEIDQRKVIINVNGNAKVSKGGFVEAVILAPSGGVSVQSDGAVSSVFGRKVAIKGAQAGGILECSTDD